MAFEEDINIGFQKLQAEFPCAAFCQQTSQFHQIILTVFLPHYNLSDIKLHLKGTDFQIKVWESLLKIPMGSLATYQDIAQEVGKPKAYRAVGTAIGQNPVAFLVPCHRVIQSSGLISGYKWGKTRKAALIGWEGSKIHECI